jgi:hypothetical protein
VIRCVFRNSARAVWCWCWRSEPRSRLRFIQSRNVGLLPGRRFRSGFALKDKGQVTRSSFGNGPSRTFRYTPGRGMENLSVLPGGRLSYGSAINNAGQVTGATLMETATRRSAIQMRSAWNTWENTHEAWPSTTSGSWRGARVAIPVAPLATQMAFFGKFLACCPVKTIA